MKSYGETKHNVEEIALSFRDLSIATSFPPTTILSNVNGYVTKGGITAVLGASASGKSVLMKGLAGRLPNIEIFGNVSLNCSSIDVRNLSNSINYVPQDDFLIGEMTPREILRSNSKMKSVHSASNIDKDVDALLKSFGLSHVADNAVGTIFVRGLSGGQRKRVEVCSELISPSTVLMLDEPTSGLDGAIAYDVLSAIKNILREKNGSLSLFISIHQPNSRILDLFDNILLLGNGGMLYFGTVPDSIKYFSSIGFPPPEIYTPTDVYLQVTDSNFGSNHDVDFIGYFACSKFATDLLKFLHEIERHGMQRIITIDQDSKSAKTVFPSDVSCGDLESNQKYEDVSFRGANMPRTDAAVSNKLFRQFTSLLYRDFMLAYRDPSLYYLQFVLVSAFGFLVGAAFFDLKIEIGSKMNNIPGGLLWIVMMMTYIQVFKVYHLSRNNDRFKHEVSNNTYDIFVFWSAELLATATLLVSFIPGTIIAFFMMGLPGDAYPFLILLFWMTALTGESMLNFLTKFSTNATKSVVTCQAVLVILTVFGGGLFIAWDKCPIYWRWLQEISTFTQASRAATMNVNDFLQYSCAMTDLGAGYICLGPLNVQFQCIPSSINNNNCLVDGRDVMYMLQGTNPDESKWVPFGYLVLIFACFRLLCLILMYYPVEKNINFIQNLFYGVTAQEILKNKIGLKSVQSQLHSYIHLKSSGDDTKYADKNESNSLVPVNGVHASKLFSANFNVETDGVKAAGACLEWKNLSVILKTKGTKLIDDVSGAALSGRILALMGPSGAGKTTLLNALSNRTPYATLKGDVTFGGRAFVPADLVYVPQFDEFNQNLTVFEQIEYVGKLKCVDALAMRRRLLRLVGILGLSNKVTTLCKHLTSGELKRVSVGMGMISNPNVLFLDEPTTGLDSSAAYSIVKYLSELSAETNVVVIMTIHQPAQIVFDMLQDLYLLESGRLAYFGPLSATNTYFLNCGYECESGVNPADFYLDLVSKAPTSAATWMALYNSSKFAENYSKSLAHSLVQNVAASPAEPPHIRQRFTHILTFFVTYYMRDIGVYYLRVAFLITVAIFVGTLFLRLSPNTENISQYSGAIFFSIWTILFSTVSATGIYASDRRQAVEQVKNAVISPGIYCLAQFIASVPFNWMCSFIFQCIFHWLINMNPNGESFVYGIFITFGHMMLMEAIMLSVVAVLKNAMLSVTFAMVVLGYLFLFSGFFIIIKDMPAWISWISYITPTMYSFDGYLWQVYSTQTFDVIGYPGYTIDGEDLLSTIYDLHNVDSWGMFGVLLAWIALFRFLHYALFYYDVAPYIVKADK